ncbi:MAG: ribosomal RNA small subunit methyltransferase A [Blastocatellia bacterium]|nr:ribosomal RNA small subunit methyltransferase A [Blastocatellia bacterium]
MRAKRRLGQNFLTGSHYPMRIVDAVSPRSDEVIIEIGPGHGALTGLLVESGAQVIAIELDRELIAELGEKYAGTSKLKLVEADALDVDFCRLIAPAATARVVANLPYYIATPILRHLIKSRVRSLESGVRSPESGCIEEMTLMLQREVVERMTARPGGKEYGYLSVLVQLYCEAEKLFDVPPGAFRPMPKVYSSVVRLRTRAAIEDDEGELLDLVEVLFSQRRKTIFNNLRAGGRRLGLQDDSIVTAVLNDSLVDPRRRAETLSLGEILKLKEEIKKAK